MYLQSIIIEIDELLIFFWLDNTISDFKEIFYNIKHLEIDNLFIPVCWIY